MTFHLVGIIASPVSVLGLVTRESQNITTALWGRPVDQGCLVSKLMTQKQELIKRSQYSGEDSSYILLRLVDSWLSWEVKYRNQFGNLISRRMADEGKGDVQKNRKKFRGLFLYPRTHVRLVKILGLWLGNMYNMKIYMKTNSVSVHNREKTRKI